MAKYRNACYKWRLLPTNLCFRADMTCWRSSFSSSRMMLRAKSCSGWFCQFNNIMSCLCQQGLIRYNKYIEVGISQNSRIGWRTGRRDSRKGMHDQIDASVSYSLVQRLMTFTVLKGNKPAAVQLEWILYEENDMACAWMQAFNHSAFWIRAMSEEMMWLNSKGPKIAKSNGCIK